MPVSPLIHPMQPADLHFAAQCTAAEGWLGEDYFALQSFYLSDPTGCFLAELSGRPVGIGIATSYGQSGFIGELIVRPEDRGKGIGTALLRYSVDYLRRRGARTIYLDGMPKAVPLYERNGFRKICRSLRFSGKMSSVPTPHVRSIQNADLDLVCALDRRAFGADRSFFLRRRLERNPELSWVLLDRDRLLGFILGRRGEGWLMAGPWVAVEDAPRPECLLQCLSAEAGNTPLSVGVLESNQPAVELIRSLGFVERGDSPWRMSLGPSSDLGASRLCWAIGSPAKG